MVLKADVPSPDCYTGETVIANGLTGATSAPLCSVFLKCKFMATQVKLGVIESLPTAGINILLGNDLAGGRLLPCPVVTTSPLRENNTQDLEESFPTLFPACAVTRSKSRANLNSDNEATAGDCILKDLFEPSPDVTPEKVRLGKSDPIVIGLQGPPITKEKLIAEQRADPELKKFYDLLVDKSELDSFPNCFYLNSDVLMRKFRPLDVPADQTWLTVHQIVVPKPLRELILSVAHDNVGGHLGVTKTYNKILSHFFWPRLKRDVGSYCRTCHICQVKGKPGAGVKPYPLCPIPVVSEPFKKIIIDCVGPLPKSKRGNQYLLTIMDVATPYPEVIPLRRITFQNVFKALI